MTETDPHHDQPADESAASDTPDQPADAGTDSTPETAEGDSASDDAWVERFKRVVAWGLFVVVMLVVLVATFRLYFAASTAVDTLVATQYRPLFQAGFNLLVLLVCGVALSWLVTRMR
jgi:hypothetical protein